MQQARRVLTMVYGWPAGTTLCRPGSEIGLPEGVAPCGWVQSPVALTIGTNTARPAVKRLKRSSAGVFEPSSSSSPGSYAKALKSIVSARFVFRRFAALLATRIKDRTVFK